jgi:hypothetical protein
MSGYRVTVRYAGTSTPYIDRPCTDASEGMRIFGERADEMVDIGYAVAEQYDDGNGFVQFRYTDETGNGREDQTVSLIPTA